VWYNFGVYKGDSMSQLKEKITESRRLLQNPYAYLDGDGGYEAEEIISASRRLLENPYAYLDGDGSYDVNLLNLDTNQNRKIVLNLDKIRNPKIVGKYISFDDIEEITKSLQNEIWKNRQQLWKDKVLDDPAALLAPAMAFEAIGYRFEIADSLGQFMARNGLVDTAGFINKADMYAGVSSYFSLPIQNFTAAHELGHAVLHNAMGMHRDRDLTGGAVSGKLERVEIEANRFASCFLMPEKIVRAEFLKRFLSEQFVISEDTAFALISDSQGVLRIQCASLRKLAQKLADTGNYANRFFEPLNKCFKVSTEAMAIRLEELKLLQF
jgi:Zn-dependent peptidase ImmA (M78 family)